MYHTYYQGNRRDPSEETLRSPRTAQFLRQRVELSTALCFLTTLPSVNRTHNCYIFSNLLFYIFFLEYVDSGNLCPTGVRGRGGSL